jgi:acetyl-CoA C-acetyltransferase
MYMKRDAVIVAAVRTAIARQGGALAQVPAHHLGAAVMKEAIQRTQLKPEMIDDVIMGNVISGGGNIARLTVLQTGIFISPVERRV